MSNNRSTNTNIHRYSMLHYTLLTSEGISMIPLNANVCFFRVCAPFRNYIQETWKWVIANMLKAAIFHLPETPDAGVEASIACLSFLIATALGFSPAILMILSCC